MDRNTENEDETMCIPRQRVYYAVFVVTSYESFDDALARSPDDIAAHVARSQELHANGTLLMGGAAQYYGCPHFT